MRNQLYLSLFLLLPACKLQTQDKINAPKFSTGEIYKTISEMPTPQGFTRAKTRANSFGEWLRNVKLKKDKRVFLYNGSLKPDQSIQFAVLDERIGNKDLQQCADAIMRLRAEYFFSANNFDSIHFVATDGTVMSFSKWRKGARYHLAGNKLSTVFINNIPLNVHDDFQSYLETVFSYAGTHSLATELVEIKDISEIQAGDVFIKPGFPGHAMIVADVCVNKEGKKMFMLAQGYMPAQDIHIVKNPLDEKNSPWYEAIGKDIVTPAWKFTSAQLKRWK